jgi:hypothetical protein
LKLELKLYIFLRIKSLYRFFKLRQITLYLLIIFLFFNYIFSYLTAVTTTSNLPKLTTRVRFFKTAYYFISVLKSPLAQRRWSQEQYSVSIKKLTLQLAFIYSANPLPLVNLTNSPRLFNLYFILSTLFKYLTSPLILNKNIKTQFYFNNILFI